MENIEEKEEQSASMFNIKDFLWLCLSKWYIFVICGLLGLGVAYYTLMKEPKIYMAEAGVMIKDKGASSQPDVASVFSEMSAFDVYSNLNNEMQAMASPAVATEVARRLGLDVQYTVKEQLHRRVLYGGSLPIKVKFLDLGENQGGKMRVLWKGDGTVEIGPFASAGEKIEDKTNSENISFNLSDNGNDTIVTPLGHVMIWHNTGFTGNVSTQQDILVDHIGVSSGAGIVSGGLKTFVTDKYSTIVNLSYKGKNQEMCRDILSEIIKVYGENWISDRNQIASATYDFINERLAVIENELGSVDSNISGMMAHQQVAVGDLNYNNQRNLTAQNEIIELTAKLKLANQVKSQLAEMIANYTILPGTSALANAGIDGKVGEFNNMISYRNSLVANSSEESPVVQDLDMRIADKKQEILSTLDAYITGLQADINVARGTQAQSAARLMQGHTQAPHIQSVERQQKVKESLYMYLLQKREENQLSQAFAPYNSKVVTEPYSYGPISPIARAIYMKWLLIGLLIPAALLFLCEILNSKVRGRKDIEKLTIPFVGEIPFIGKPKSTLQKLMRKKTNEDETSQVLVKKSSGNIVNEAFRVIRTNLEFMVPPGISDARSIMITSANPGSGKTFITLNLGAVLALKNKKVAIVDLDLRKAALSLSCSASGSGVSNYLVGSVELDDIVVKNVLGCENVDLFPVGPIPPNPAELLYHQRLEEMIEKLKENYDYVLVDCPPVEVVADAKIINRLVDLTLFVIRAELLERAMLKEIQKFYDTKRYNNLAIILNGTPNPSHSKLRRSNRFGYGYGYGYGYPRKKN